MATLVMAGTVVAGQIRPGQWEVTQTMVMGGMKMPPVTVSQCVTPDAAGDPGRAMPQDASKPDCRITEQKMQDNQLSWRVACSGETAMEGVGQMTYGSDAYEGKISYRTTSGEAADMGDMITYIKGRRTGDCQ